jgi:beta-N-acetylhexosaminidase
VNNNPRNPVINTRSYGEDPGRVAALVGAYIDGAREAGMIATIKHFPGHGDTDVDSHLDLPVIPFDRARLNQLELVPFQRGIEHGAGAVMAAHVELPALDAAAATPATFSRPILHDLLRRELRFDGLLYTDSMSMDNITRMLPADEAAVRAALAGADQVLHSPDPVAAFNGVKAAMASRRIGEARLNDARDRILRAKASLGLHQQRAVDLDAIPEKVGGRAHQAVAEEASMRSMTLVKDERRYVPLAVPRDTPLLYLSVLDYPAAAVSICRRSWFGRSATLPAPPHGRTLPSSRRFSAIRTWPRRCPKRRPCRSPTTSTTLRKRRLSGPSAVKHASADVCPIALPGLFPVGHGIDR